MDVDLSLIIIIRINYYRNDNTVSISITTHNYRDCNVPEVVANPFKNKMIAIK